MSTPLYQPANARSDASGNALFTFNVVPPGFVWTMTLVPTANTTGLTLGKIPPAALDVFGQSVWTLQRNGIPEMTWVGYTLVTDFQAFGNDRIAVSVSNVTPNTQLLLTMRGSSDLSDTVPALPPRYSAALPLGAGADPTQMQEGVAGLVVNGTSSILVVGAAGVQLQLWDISWNVVGMNDVGSGGATQQFSAEMRGTVSNTLIDSAAAMWGGQGQSCSVSRYINMRGLYLPVGDGVKLTVPTVAVGSNMVADATITFTLA